MRLYAFYMFLLCLVPSIFIHPYIGVLLYSWISFMSPQRLVWGFHDEIPLALVTAVMTVISWLLSNEPKRLRVDATAWLIVAFMILVSLTTLVALNPHQAIPEWDLTAKALLFVLITMALTTNRVRFHALLWVMAVSIGFYGLRGGIFALLHGGAYRVYGPAGTAIGDNNDIAAGLAVALPLMNYVRMNSPRRWMRIAWVVIMAASVLAILSTYSRGGLLGLVAVGVFLWLKSRRKLLAGIVIGVMAVVMIGFMPAQYFARIQTIVNYQADASAMDRIEIWGAALKIALARPMTGGGFRVTQSQAVIDRYDPGVQARDEHNVYIGVLADQGFVGLLIWLLLPLVGWRNSRWLVRNTKGRPEWQWANDFARMSQVSMVAYFVVGSFGNYQYWDYYFTILGLLAAARHITERAAVPVPIAAAPALRRIPAGGAAASSQGT